MTVLYFAATCVCASAGSEATKGRTSLTCHLAKKAHPSPILLQKIQDLTNKPFGHMELPQVARYTDSQRYVEHYDGVDPHTEAGRTFCASGGQRVATVLDVVAYSPTGTVFIGISSLLFRVKS